MAAPVAGAAPEPTLVLPLKELFSHGKHAEGFSRLNVSCTDCHDFSIRAKTPGPLSDPVRAGLLHPKRSVCHDCHNGRLTLPRPNQCLLCHAQTDALKPRDHFLSWTSRHGKMAQMDRDSCAQCHAPTGCANCHSRMDTMNPSVHKPNFRLTHSIQARAHPQTCVECHRSAPFCADCHNGGRK